MGTLSNWIALCLSVVVVTHYNPANTAPSTANRTVTLGVGNDSTASNDSVGDTFRDDGDEDDDDGTGDDYDDGVVDSAGMVYTLIGERHLNESLHEDDYSDEYYDDDYYDDYDDLYFDDEYYDDDDDDDDNPDDGKTPEIAGNYTLADDPYSMNMPKEIVLSDEEINKLMEKGSPIADGAGDDEDYFYDNYFDDDDYFDYDYEDEEDEEDDEKNENRDSDSEAKLGGEQQTEGKEEASEENKNDSFLSFHDYNLTFHKNNITFLDYISLYNISFEDYNISFEEYNVSSEDYPFDSNMTLVDYIPDLEAYPEFNVTLEDFNATYEEYENGTIFDVTFVSNEVLDNITKVHNATDEDDEVKEVTISTTDSSDDAGRLTTESPESHAEPENLRIERDVDLDEYKRVYDTLIASGLLSREEEEEVRALERMRRSLESLGGLDALRGNDELAHRIVKRQLTGSEACGTFSKRRRRDTDEPSSFLASPSSPRKRRGITNVGKRLEQDNASFKQLYNQFKIMCRFVAMVIFEK